ncbi:MAG: SprT protein [Marivirga sp.]|jgi:SprT protein
MDPYQEKIHQRIARFVPEPAVNEAYHLWEKRPFRFIISKARNSKLGDFRKRPNDALAVITVNENLNPYNFLITFVHEVAHHWVYEEFKNQVAPHGIEWKKQFASLMEPFLLATIFPQAVLGPLKRYMINPKASSQSDIRLASALALFDENRGGQEGIALHTLTVGTAFLLEDRTFQSIESRRTRVRCKELESGRHYLVHKLALVKPIIEE